MIKSMNPPSHRRHAVQSSTPFVLSLLVPIFGIVLASLVFPRLSRATRASLLCISSRPGCSVGAIPWDRCALVCSISTPLLIASLARFLLRPFLVVASARICCRLWCPLAGLVPFCRSSLCICLMGLIVRASPPALSSVARIPGVVGI